MIWEVDGTRASLQMGDLRAEVDLERPRHGVSQIVLRGSPQNKIQLFRLVADGSYEGGGRVPAKSHVRGVDLVASYSETPKSPVSLEVYWRAVADVDALCGIELLVSEQTGRLESDPQLRCSTRLPKCELLRLADPEAGHFTALTIAAHGPVFSVDETELGAFLFRPANADWSYGEITHPADFTWANIIVEDAGLTFTNHLFRGEVLEKGVIRRARLLGLFLPRIDDKRRFAEAYQLFVASELPLTA